MSTHDRYVFADIKVSKRKQYCCSQNLLIIYHRKGLIEKPVNFLHLNLSIALLLGLILFVGGVETAVSIPV